MATATPASGASVRWMDRQRAIRPDFVLVFSLLALSSLGILMVFSTSSPRLEALGIDPAFEVRRQAIFVSVGLVGFVAASAIGERMLRRLAPIAYVTGVLFLLAVLTPLGARREGAQRWIPLGDFQFQPSEFAKPALILALAVLLTNAREEGMRWPRVFAAVGLIAVPSVLIFLQPDIGTMITFGLVGLAMLFVAGATMRQLVTLMITGLMVVVFALSLGVLKEYQLNRLTGFLDQESNLQTANYNQFQSRVTIGSGQIFGKGLFQGDQTNLSFVPAQTTDFIFTAVAEQLGFVGGALVLGLYAVVVIRLLMAAANANTRFGQLVAAGVAALVGFHVFVNIGMTMGLMPVTGLPLPFMSAGGSAYLAVAGGVGVAHSIWVRRSPVKGERRLLE